jgi:HK97 gp10 family phage protein
MRTAAVSGLRELDRALGELPKATARNTLIRTLKKAGQPMADHASGLAHVLTGTLRNSAAVSTKLTKRQAGLHKKDRSKAFAEVFAGFGGLTQAITEEFGTAEIAANPMMRPAWDAGQDGALEIIKNDLGEEIMKSAKRLAKKLAKGG